MYRLPRFLNYKLTLQYAFELRRPDKVRFATVIPELSLRTFSMPSISAQGCFSENARIFNNSELLELINHRHGTSGYSIRLGRGHHAREAARGHREAAGGRAISTVFPAKQGVGGKVS
ncbi:hypothetical protein U8607_11670 [Methylobacterium durans]|uniref:hypothetical protein n=1 Tax=Methylobacterium durans TaxID=2202825 RepID=UPI002AFEF457|nr:hypothetical protein [Methylobacterium durans]MEA1832741.1 hypothetical protein [Methylobacterium durans]